MRKPRRSSGLTGTKPAGTGGITACGGAETGNVAVEAPLPPLPELPELPDPAGGEVGPEAPVAGVGVGVPPGGAAGGTASGALTVTRSATGGLRTLVRGFVAVAAVRLVVVVDWVECELLEWLVVAIFLSLGRFTRQGSRKLQVGCALRAVGRPSAGPQSFRETMQGPWPRSCAYARSAARRTSYAVRVCRFTTRQCSASGHPGSPCAKRVTSGRSRPSRLSSGQGC